MKNCINCVNLRTVSRIIQYDDGGKDMITDYFCVGSDYYGYLIDDIPETCKNFYSIDEELYIREKKNRVWYWKKGPRL